VNGPRDADTAGVGQAFEACGNVHPITEDVIVLDNDVTDVDADPVSDTPLLGHVGIALRHRVLDLYCALDGLNGARELGQQTVAHQLDDAPMILGDLGVDQLFAMGLQCRQRARLILSNKAAVTDYVCGQNGGKPALHRKSPSTRRLATVEGRIYAVGIAPA
jgi:hypothetical protein